MSAAKQTTVLAAGAVLTAGLLAVAATAFSDEPLVRNDTAQGLDGDGHFAAWSQHGPHGFVVKVADSRGHVSRARIAPLRYNAATPHVGTWGRRAVLVYARCPRRVFDPFEGYGCNVYRYDILGRREVKIRRIDSERCEEFEPASWHDTLVFARRGRECRRPGLYRWQRGERPARIVAASDDRAEPRFITGTDIRGEVIAYSISDYAGGGSVSSTDRVRARIGNGPFRTLATTFVSPGLDFPLAEPRIRAHRVFWIRFGRTHAAGSTVQRRDALAQGAVESATRWFDPAIRSFGFLSGGMLYERSGVYRVDPPLEFRPGGVDEDSPQ